MSSTIFQITDSPMGINRLVIGSATFGLGKIGNRLALDYIFSTMRDIEAKCGIEVRIVLAYADGLSKSAPLYSRQDLFYLHSLPARSSRKTSTDLEARLKQQLFERCAAHKVELLRIEQLSSLSDWYQRNSSDDDIILHVTSGQVALNVDLTLKLLDQFRAGQDACLAAEGHSVGLTPVIYRSNHWQNILQSCTSETPFPDPPPQQKVNLNLSLKAMASNKVRIAYENGRNIRIPLLLKQKPAIASSSPEEIIQEYKNISETLPYFSISGRQFEILTDFRMEYFSGGKGRPTFTIKEHWNEFQREAVLLAEHAGYKVQGTDVLEIGCGPGIMGTFFKSAGARRVVLTDYNINAGTPYQRAFLAQWSQSGAGNPKIYLEENRLIVEDPDMCFVENAGESIPFRDNSFDLVYSNQVLEHVNDPQKTLLEMIRVVRKGGILMLRYNPWFNLQGGHGDFTTDILWGHVMMTPDELVQYIEDIEFPERAAASRENLKHGFTPGRMTITQFNSYLERLLPAQILHYSTIVKLDFSEKVTPALLERCRDNYSEMGLQDLFIKSVEAIIRK